VIDRRRNAGDRSRGNGFKTRVFAFSAGFVPDTLGPQDGPVLNAEMYVQKESRALDAFLDQADARLRNQYTLAYYSTHTDDRRRDIRVTTMPPHIDQAGTR
jgi:hypothetical protein